MSKGLGYSRLSQQSDTSIDRQKTHIRDYCDEHDIDLEEILDDGEGSSGFETQSREEYQKLRSRVAAGEVEAIVVNDKRRLARDFDDTMRLILDCREHDIELHTWQEGELDLSDPMRASIEVLQAASDYEAKMKEIERAREAVAERIEAGHAHGRPRFGMQYSDDGTEQVPGDDFDTVRDILHYDRIGKTLHEIEDLTGVAKSTVHNILQRRQWYVSKEKLAEN